MNIENDRKDILEFRAYEMRRLLRILNNKVRSQKLTNKFIAYNSDMSEKDMLEYLDVKPIKHETYVRFFNSIIAIIANHREESNKDKIEYEVMEDMKRDPLIEPNRISQIVKWNDYLKTNKVSISDSIEKLVEAEEVVVEKQEEKSRDQILNELTNDMLELMSITNPSYDNILTSKKVVCNIIKNIKNPVISYYKCSSIKDVIQDTAGKSGNATFSVYLYELQQKTKESVKYYFYPATVPKLIIDKEYLTAIINVYIEYMNKNYNINRFESLKILADKEKSKREIYQKHASSRFLSRLVREKHKKHLYSNDTSKRDIFDIESIKPVQKDKFNEELLKVIGPYHIRKDNYRLNSDGNTFNINVWVVGTAIINIYKKLGIDKNKSFCTDDQKFEKCLNNVAAKYIRKDLNRTYMLNCVEKTCLAISISIQIDDINLCRGIVMDEIKKEVVLLNKDLDDRLNSKHLKHFDKVIKHLFNLEPTSKLNKSGRRPTILSAIIKSFLPLVYNITRSRLAKVDAKSKYASDIGDVKINPMISLDTCNSVNFEKYSYSIIECLAQQLNNVLDGRGVDYKVIADELRAFIVYQVENHYDYFGIKPIELNGDICDVEESDPIVLNEHEEDSNSNSVEEVEEENTHEDKDIETKLDNKEKDMVNGYMNKVDAIKILDININKMNKLRSEVLGSEGYYCQIDSVLDSIKLDDTTQEVGAKVDTTVREIQQKQTPSFSAVDLYKMIKNIEVYMRQASEKEQNDLIEIITSFKK